MPEETMPVEYRQLPVKLVSFSVPAGVQAFTPHWHSRLEILQIDKGTMHLVVDGRSFTATAGDTVCVCPRCSHAGQAGDTGVIYRTIMFELSKMEDALPATTQFIRPLLSGVARLSRLLRDDEVRREIDTMTGEYFCRQPSALLLEGQMYRLLGQLFRHHTDEEHASHAIDHRLRQAIDYIDGHYTEPLSAAEMAKRFHYTESYFCRRFRQQTGLTPVAYIHSLRLNQAARLLLETDLSTAQISARCGYDSDSYFIRRFRQQFGITPGQWRRAGLG